MERHDDPALLDVAKAISDGTQVDWENQSAAREDLKVQFARLRLIEAVAAAHWSVTPRAPQPIVGSFSRQTTLSHSDTTPAPPVNSDSGSITRWGPLRISRKLGHGGFGEVFRAFDPTLQREVALKLRRRKPSDSGEETQRFIDEGRRLARVRHPNVLVVHGADDHDGRAGLWTDLLEGKTLEQLLTEQGPFSGHEAAVIGIDLCRALAAVHRAGLIHRDIKTSNVMRETGGRIVLLDFGLVTDVADAARQTSGTPLTMAPELLLRGETPSVASDIYSMGVLLYRLASGRFPTQETDFARLLEKHRRGESVPLRDVRPDLPTSFVQVVERALCSEPDQRYASAGQMESALAASLGAMPQAADPATEPPAPVHPGPGKVSRWPIAVSISLVLGISLLLSLRSSRNFSVEASLYRRGPGVEERLLSGSRVQPGDALFMEVRGSESLHFYVLNEDAQGRTTVLYPVNLDLKNPLPPQDVHRLPGSLAGGQQYWQVTSSGGREKVVVIASRHPLADLEQEIVNLPRVESGRPVAYEELSAQAISRVMRGIGGMVGAEALSNGVAPKQLGALARLLPDHEESASGIWIRQIELENTRK